MAHQFRPWRIVVAAIVTATVTSATAVVINVATEWKTSWWPWIAVVVLTLVGAVISAWMTSEPLAPVAPAPPALDAKDVDLSGEAEVRPLEGTAIRMGNLTAKDRAKLIVERNAPGAPDVDDQ